MLHTYQRALAAIGHAQRRFHGRFFIGAPTAAHPAFPRKEIILNEFRNFGGGGSGISVHAGQTGMQRSQSQSLVTEQESFSHHSKFEIQLDKVTKNMEISYTALK
jgi:hypothetical protein